MRSRLSRSTRESGWIDAEAAVSRPRLEIVVEELGGWVRVLLGRGEPTGELAGYPSHSLTG
jgi:hypothetical protein